MDFIGEDGYYDIYRRMVTHGHVEKLFLGRLALEHGVLEIIEDNDGELHRVFREGPFDDQHLHRLEQLDQSPYFMLYHTPYGADDGTQTAGEDATVSAT